MSSEEEEENFCFFGKPLDPYDEDAIPKKRPITVEEQIATDAQGRRRFHGAFTGGFSAGFFNTVGSLEGWTPSEFKSTRQDKAQKVLQKPADFMDQEDLGEYGIAPQTIRATKDYSTSKKRRKQVFSEGPIPGVPVLETLLTTGNETIGYLLLRKIGVKDKIKARNEEFDPNAKIYGCQIPQPFKIPEKLGNKQYKIPDIYTDNLATPKSNTFGLDYKGLDRSHVNLFAPSNLVVRDRNNKKFSIAGQAFGVGAFEEEDDDIYMKEDMSNYDFELVKEKNKEKKVNIEVQYLFGMFKPSKSPLMLKKIYPPPVIPHSFTGKHKVKKSRFEAVVKIEEEQEISRGEINPAIRAKYLGEETPDTYTPSLQIQTHKDKALLIEKEASKKRKSFDVSSLMIDKFVSASQTEDVSNILEPVKKAETLHGTKDMREAAKMKMFGQLTRASMDWTPCALLCKRFNVPEPLMDRPELKNRKRTKNLIFENQKFTDETDVCLKPGVSLPSTSSSEAMPISETDNENIDTSNDVQTIVKTEEMSPEPLKPSEDKPDADKNDKETVVKDITEKIGVEEKVDLFKAVFLSSSESESEDEETDKKEENDNNKKTEEFKEAILSDLVPKIRPLKQGILSNITFQPRAIKIEDALVNSQMDCKIIENSREEENPSSSHSSEPKITSYGPQLPIQKVVSGSSKIDTINLNDSEDEWVEKGSKSKHKKSKHKKDKKKEKKKHKHSKKDKNY